MAGMLFVGCNCGFEAVEECAPSSCAGQSDAGGRDAGNDAGSRDAGTLDAGEIVDAGEPDAGRPDAGDMTDAGGFDAGRDAGDLTDAGGFDAGGPADAGCLDELRRHVTVANGDYIAVRGTAGVYGQVDFMLGGYSAGASSADGIQRFTNTSFLNVRVPSGVFDTGLWMWTANNAPAATNTRYVGDNVDQYFGNVPFINFRISPSVSCSAGGGTGSFQFVTFRAPGANAMVEGDFDFQCLDAGISVSGCFRYGQ